MSRHRYHLSSSLLMVSVLAARLSDLAHTLFRSDAVAITDITPLTGPATGGTDVVITGTNFVDTSSVV